MKTLLCTWLLLLSLSILGQAPPLQWISATGDNSSDIARSVCYDAAGNVYSAGYFTDTVDFDPSVSVFTLASNGNQDIFVMKNDANGNFLWAKSLGGGGTDVAHCINITTNGDLLITGDFESVMDADPSASTYNLPFNGYKDVFILKLNSSGNFIWAKSFGSTGEENAYVLTQDLSGNIYIGGCFSYTTDFDPGPGNFTLTANSSLRDSYTLKLDATGNFIWAKTFGGSVADDNVFGLSVDPAGNLLVSAIFMFTVDVDPGPTTFTLASPNAWSTAIIKLDPAGIFLWGKKIGSNDHVFCNKLATDASGNVYTIGNFEGTADFDPGANIYNITSAGYRDIWVSKLDASGNFVWAKTMGGTQFMDIGQDITVDAAGDLYLTGSFDGIADMDPNAGTYTLSTVGGYGDIFVMKLSSAGNLLWIEGFGSSGDDMGFSIKTDPAGNIYLAGFYSGTTDFYPGPPSYTVNGDTNNDLFVLKLQACSATSPPQNITSNNLQNICVNNSSTLTASGSIFMTWYNAPSGGNVLATTSSFITLALTASGVYTYYVEGNSGCGNTGRTAVTITVYPQPTLTIAATNTIICTGEPLIISAAGANTYSWNTGVTTSTLSVNSGTSANYVATGFGINGCSNTASLSITVSPCTGIAEKAINKVFITPNPASDFINIVIPESESDSYDFCLINSAGQVVRQEKGVSIKTLVINDLAKGFYYLQINYKEELFHIKLIKN